MTVSTLDGYFSSDGNGATTEFAFNGALLTGTDLIVELVNKTTGAVTAQTEVTHYTVAIASNWQSAVVTFLTPPPATHRVVRRRKPNFLQQAKMRSTGRLPSEAIEQAIDRIVMSMQAVRDSGTRGIRLSDSDSPTLPALPALELLLGKYIYINGAGAPVGVDGPANVPIAAAWTPVVTAASLAAGLTAAGFSALAQSLIGGVSQAAMQAILGVGPGRRNRFVNGDLEIDQEHEGAAQTIVAAAAIAYTVDQWYAQCTGADVTGQRVAGTAPNRYAYKFTGAGGNTLVRFGQRIEAADCADLVNQDVVVSLQVKSSSLVSLTWKAYHANAADDFSAKTQIATNTIVGIGAALASKSFTFNAGANAANGLCIEFESGALLAAETLQFENLQHEPGTSPTTFERRGFRHRLADCQRFWEKSYSAGVVPGTNTSLGMRGLAAQVISTNDQISIGFANVHMTTPKRALPTITTYSQGGTPGKVQWFVGVSSGTVDSVVGNIGMNAFGVHARGVAGPTSGQGAELVCHFVANARL